jgi:hypothetical protein
MVVLSKTNDPDDREDDDRERRFRTGYLVRSKLEYVVREKRSLVYLLAAVRFQL